MTIFKDTVLFNLNTIFEQNPLQTIVSSYRFLRGQSLNHSYSRPTRTLRKLVGDN